MAELEQVFQIDQTRENLEKLLPWQLQSFAEAIAQAAANAAQGSRCGCGAEIVWGEYRGKTIPRDRDTGEMHELTCTKARPGFLNQVQQPKPQTSKCRSCGAEIYWGKTPAGKNCPFDLDGESHFKSCPQAGSWGKAKHSPSASIMGQCQCSECSK